MKVALTGATGFLGRYILEHLHSCNHEVRAWYRSAPLTDYPKSSGLQWLQGGLGDPGQAKELLSDCEALVHAALDRPGKGFTGAEGDLLSFAQTNIQGSLILFETARQLGLKKVIFISTCAVHDIILADRNLDESHPLWPKSHYGAHKAALEKFVHSMGLGDGFDICALRPTGIYGLAEPRENSKWFNLIQNIKNDKTVEVSRGGKEVHAFDVARAVGLLLDSQGTQGQAYNCYDRYISEYDVAQIAKRLCNSTSEVVGTQPKPKNQICTNKLEAMGMKFSGATLLERTIAGLLE